MSKPERRRFSREFKLKVIERLEAGESGTALALELSIKRTIIYRATCVGHDHVWREREIGRHDTYCTIHVRDMFQP